MKLPIYEAKITDDGKTGIFAMSFVKSPAVEVEFVALSKTEEIQLSINSDKQILSGVVLVPEKLIFRDTPQLGQYYMKFTASDIEQIARKMVKTGTSLFATTHEHSAELAGNQLVELWTVENPQNDKANALGLGELPKGTLCASYFVQDKAYWNEQIKTGEVKGFSLEGLFNLFEMAQPKTTAELAKERAKAFLTKVKALLSTVDEVAALETPAAADATESGDPYIIFTLADNSELAVGSDGFATIGGTQAPAGQHSLADGNTIVIDDAGYLVETTPTATSPDPAAAAAAVGLAKARAEAFFKAVKPAEVPSEAQAEIARLKEQIALLNKTPSVPPVKPLVETSAKLSKTEAFAEIIKAQRQRKEGK